MVKVWCQIKKRDRLTSETRMGVWPSTGPCEVDCDATSASASGQPRRDVFGRRWVGDSIAFTRHSLVSPAAAAFGGISRTIRGPGLPTASNLEELAGRVAQAIKIGNWVCERERPTDLVKEARKVNFTDAVALLHALAPAGSPSNQPNTQTPQPESKGKPFKLNYEKHYQPCE